MSSADDRSESVHPFICHVNLDRGFRGGERQTELLVRQLAERGWKQRLVLRSGAMLEQRLSDVPGLEIELCEGLVSAARRIGRPDLVHVHQGRAIYPALLRRVFGGVPYVVTRRVPNPTGQGWLSGRAYRYASRLVAISESVAGILGDSVGVPRGQITVIPDSFKAFPMDHDRAHALREQWGARFVVGHVGALEAASKGQSDLIAVARQFADLHPEIHFVLVGAGRDEARFRQEGQGLHNLHLTGFQERVGDYLASFDLFAFPSLAEGMGSVLLDVMNQGLAVVATRVGGIPELVSDGQTGLLVPPSRPDELARAILALYADPERRREMGEAGKRRSRLFSAPVMAERYIQIYDEVLA